MAFTTLWFVAATDDEGGVTVAAAGVDGVAAAPTSAAGAVGAGAVAGVDGILFEHRYCRCCGGIRDLVELQGTHQAFAHWCRRGKAARLHGSSSGRC
jgi:hypothetical protein